ncbi:MAG TPA: 2-oxoacid:acceptor oxidoreductase family protein [Thermodesulfobacteriota bacterium]|nr:2-oxoacid:acceptor oxidoreductase family protein [Thermodesulfobacteriota bacterium]
MKRYEIRIAGFGGQGVVTVGKIVGLAAALYDGKNAVQTQSYGPESRGGACKSEVVLSDGKIHYPKVRNADVLVALSQPALDIYLKDLKPGGVVIIDPLTVIKEVPRTDVKVVKVPTAEIALKVGNKKFQNMVALGALAKVSGVIDSGSFEKAIGDSVPPKTLTQNLEAFKKGKEYVRS